MPTTKQNTVNVIVDIKSFSLRRVIKIMKKYVKVLFKCTRFDLFAKLASNGRENRVELNNYID